MLLRPTRTPEGTGAGWKNSLSLPRAQAWCSWAVPWRHTGSCWQGSCLPAKPQAASSGPVGPAPLCMIPYPAGRAPLGSWNPLSLLLWVLLMGKPPLLAHAVTLLRTVLRKRTLLSVGLCSKAQGEEGNMEFTKTIILGWLKSSFRFSMN